MAEIKRYSSKVSRSGDSQKAPLDPSQYSATGKLMSDIGDALGSLSDNFIQAQEFQQKTKAVNTAKMSISEILSRAEQDPNPENTSMYANEISKVHEQVSKGISLRGAQNAFDLDFGTAANNGMIKLKQMQRTKIIDLGLASIEEGLNGLDVDYMNSSIADEPRVLEQMNQLIEGGYSNGFMTAQDMQEMKEKNLETLGAKKAVHMINNANSVEEIEAIKQALLNGEFEQNGVTIDPDKKKSILSNADTAIKKQEERFKEFQMQTVNDLGEMLAEGSLTQSIIENSISSGSIDAEMGVAYLSAILSPEKWSEALKTDIDKEKVRARADSFINPLKSMDESDIDSRISLVKNALKNFNDKKLNLDELVFIFRTANGKSTDPENPVWAFLKNASEYAEKNMDRDPLVKVMKKFMGRWDFKEDPREVMKQAMIDQQKEENPDTAGLNIGDVISRKGRSFTVVGFGEDGKPRFTLNG